jgi:hypothetical protein
MTAKPPVDVDGEMVPLSQVTYLAHDCKLYSITGEGVRT